MLLFDTTSRSRNAAKTEEKRISCLLIPWAVNPDCLRFLPQRAYRHHRNLTSTTACWLISRSIIIGHFPLRTCLPQTGCTPVVPLGSLDAIFFTPDRRMQECHCAPVTASEMVNVSGLLDMAGIHIVILCCSRNRYCGILSGICQSTMRGIPEETIRPIIYPLIRYSHKIAFCTPGNSKFYNFLIISRYPKKLLS